MRKIYLASESPRRRELLARVGIPFEPVDRAGTIAPPPFDPKRPEDYVTELATAKAKAAIAPNGALILGCDTIVVQNGDLLEKPSSPESAANFLRRLQANSHKVYTGIALWEASSAKLETDFEVTEVFFGPLSEEEIKIYIESGEPMDKAGAYGIQEKGALLVREIRGDYFNVVGLPLFRLTELLGRFDIPKLSILGKA